MRIRDGDSSDPESGMEKVGSGMPDPGYTSQIRTKKSTESRIRNTA
jgi:hypothetical protein